MLNACRTVFSIAVLLFVSLACAAGIANAEKRVALVIGNSAYSTVPKLVTPQNDAVAVGAALSRLGFEVILGLDLDERQMLKTFSQFQRKLNTADVALLYYAGHGLQVGGANYLVPTDASLESELELQAQAMHLNVILNMMEHPSRTSIILLDACRDNPMAKRLSRSMGTRSSSVGRGFARISTGVGTYIGFSTEPGNVALDGDGEHSPFAEALLNNIEKTNLDIESIMRQVRSEVYKKTRGRQTPWGNSSLIGKGFIFNRLLSKLAVKSDEKSKPNITPKLEPNNNLAEITYWNSIKDAKSLDLFQSYLDKYPKGLFVQIAKHNMARIEELKKWSKEIVAAKLEENNSAVIQPKEIVSKETIRNIQRELNRLGCTAGRADGLWGKSSRKALVNYKKHAKVQLATLEPGGSILNNLKNQNSRVCPLECKAGFTNKKNKCVSTRRKIESQTNPKKKNSPNNVNKIAQQQKSNKEIDPNNIRRKWVCFNPWGGEERYTYMTNYEKWRGSQFSCKLAN